MQPDLYQPGLVYYSAFIKDWGQKEVGTTLDLCYRPHYPECSKILLQLYST